MDYTWIDASRKRVKLPAPQYIDYVLTWVEGLIKDEAVFPTKAGREFSPNFPSVARHIYTQLLRIFAHLYHAHYEVYLHLSMEGHLNSLFAHFLTFGREFDLLEPKECRAPKEGWPFVIGDLMDVSLLWSLVIPPKNGSLMVDVGRLNCRPGARSTSSRPEPVPEGPQTLHPIPREGRAVRSAIPSFHLLSTCSPSSITFCIVYRPRSPCPHAPLLRCRLAHVTLFRSFFPHFAT